MDLRAWQEDAVNNLGNGKILWGNVGSGKSIAALAYYVKKESPKHIYVITTAKKRDSLDWEGEAAKFSIGTYEHDTAHGILTVDSWNKIGWYTDVKDAFFIFDEQRVVGHGAWVRSFIKIAKKNNWILLSATPGDTWLDYAPVFIANGYYKNITDFKFQHVLYEPFMKYPKIRGYLNEAKLELLRNEVLVEMPYIGESKRALNFIDVDYDKELFKRVYKDRWHIFEDRPLKDAGEMWRVMRRLVNSDPSRLEEIYRFKKLHPRLIIFYNFNYELEILRNLNCDFDVFEWNGHHKDPLPESDNWVYLVQYVSGAEGWNCTSTDAMVLYSLTYSYKNFEQSQGRIDRMNTEFDILFYYVLVSNSVIDRAIRRSLKNKESFNERKFLREIGNLEKILEDSEQVVQI